MENLKITTEDELTEARNDRGLQLKHPTTDTTEFGLCITENATEALSLPKIVYT